MDDPLDSASPPEPRPGPPEDCDLALCVLSSSSSGNCTALVLGRAASRRLVLIDLGLSPRRTRRLLESVGLAGVPIAAALITHLDDDHYYSGWCAALPPSCAQHLHRRHRARAERRGALASTTRIFDAPFELFPGTLVHPILQSHDDLGSVAFRITHDAGSKSATLGFATDLGRANAPLIQLLAGVQALAIESNYCPRLQQGSARPDFMKRRIMGGSGHLSNEQCADAAARIAPRDHVVLLHLSRECNRPELAASYHAQRPYALTIAHPQTPSPWVALRAAESDAPSPTPLVQRPPSLQRLLLG